MKWLSLKKTMSRNALEGLRSKISGSELCHWKNVVHRSCVQPLALTVRAMRKSWIWITAIAGLGLWLGCNTEPLFKIKVSLPKGANGIAFNAKDVLYIASLGGNEIVVADASTGTILKKLGLEQGVEAPDDVAFGPDGSLYWTSFDTGKVCRLSPQGLRSEQMLTPGVNPIAFSDDGRLFVAVAYKGDALYELDPFFRHTPRVILRNLGWLNGMNWGRDGYLYAPVWSKGQVVRINVDSGETAVVADGFSKPAAVKFDSRARLHLVDYETGKVWQINIQTGTKQVLIHLPPHLDNLAFDSQDRLFVSHGEKGNIYEILSVKRTRTVGQNFLHNR
jgi:sugar lactone lactonase YvrE